MPPALDFSSRSASVFRKSETQRLVEREIKLAANRGTLWLASSLKRQFNCTPDQNRRSNTLFLSFVFFLWIRKRRTITATYKQNSSANNQETIDRAVTAPRRVSNVRARFAMIETAINRVETAPRGNTTGAFDVWRLLRSSPADEIKLLRPPAKRNPNLAPPTLVVNPILHLNHL